MALIIGVLLQHSYESCRGERNRECRSWQQESLLLKYRNPFIAEDGHLPHENWLCTDQEPASLTIRYSAVIYINIQYSCYLEINVLSLYHAAKIQFLIFASRINPLAFIFSTPMVGFRFHCILSSNILIKRK